MMIHVETLVSVHDAYISRNWGDLTACLVVGGIRGQPMSVGNFALGEMGHSRSPVTLESFVHPSSNLVQCGAQNCLTRSYSKVGLQLG